LIIHENEEVGIWGINIFKGVLLSNLLDSRVPSDDLKFTDTIKARMTKEEDYSSR
jgi:hypothetical protein